MSDIVRSPRLVLRPLTVELAQAILDGDATGRNWSPGYPTDGDRVVAGLLAGKPAPDDDHRRFGLYEVQLLTNTGPVTIGGIGFRGPPVDGVVELGYGIAQEVRGQGLTTEAVHAMVTMAAQDPRVTVVQGRTTDDNPASRRVLEKAGFSYAGRDDSNPDELLLVFHHTVIRS